jgi:hypothetical protein
MRAYEFLNENKKSLVRSNLKPHRDQEMAIQAVHRVAGTADRHYDLNRIMMYAAGTDGDCDVPMTNQSWAGRNNIAVPYTKLESDMLKKAYTAMDVEWDDALKPNKSEKSIEPKNNNVRSPVPVIKKNRYGV